MSTEDRLLFGDTSGWHEADWTASDDRVRGGKSQSYLRCSEGLGRFTGDLDIKTLGGAGFASQRTTGEDREWNLSKYAGILLQVAKWDSKRYTFILKDELLPRDPKSGRDQATISYEYDFVIPEPSLASEKKGSGAQVFIPWSHFKPTYRGKEKKDAATLNVKSIKRMSIMMRSFFGDQHGNFSLSLRAIKAVASAPIMCRALEDGYASNVTIPSRWVMWSRSFRSIFSPWRLCGYLFLIFAVCYSQGMLTRSGQFKL